MTSVWPHCTCACNMWHATCWLTLRTMTSVWPHCACACNMWHATCWLTLRPMTRVSDLIVPVHATCWLTLRTMTSVWPHCTCACNLLTDIKDHDQCLTSLYLCMQHVACNLLTLRTMTRVSDLIVPVHATCWQTLRQGHDQSVRQHCTCACNMWHSVCWLTMYTNTPPSLACGPHFCSQTMVKCIGSVPFKAWVWTRVKGEEMRWLPDLIAYKRKDQVQGRTHHGVEVGDKSSMLSDGHGKGSSWHQMTWCKTSVVTRWTDWMGETWKLAELYVMKWFEVKRPRNAKLHSTLCLSTWVELSAESERQTVGVQNTNITNTQTWLLRVRGKLLACRTPTSQTLKHDCLQAFTQHKHFLNQPSLGTVTPFILQLALMTA